MRILITDIVYPNKYALWRLNTITNFQSFADIDILVPRRIDNFASVNLSFDYTELKDIHNLTQYDLLVFDQKYNCYNKIVNKDFDGTQYNSKLPFAYMLRLKKYRDTPLDFKSYNFVYHIFYMCYTEFNSKASYPFYKQILHLYPGGAFKRTASVNLKIQPISIHTDVKVIATQSYTTEYLQNKHKNKIYNIYGGFFLLEGEVLKAKPVNNSELTICFTSMGGVASKGANFYRDLVDLYYQKFPSNRIQFITIGQNSLNCKNIKHYNPISQYALNDFYYKNVDIYVNFDGNKDVPGFPHGIEAAKQGVILLTTDIHHLNNKNNYNFDKFFICSNLEEFCDRIYTLDINRNELQRYSKVIQQKLTEIFNPSKQLETLKSIFSAT